MNRRTFWSEIKNAVTKAAKPKLWKSLDHLTESDEYKKFEKEEYPHGAAEFEKPLDRREVLKVMGASMAMAALAGCSRQPDEQIIPYVKSPEEIIPGKPLFYATSMAFNGHHTGLLVESHMGRPTRIEGNPEHPDSLGAASIFHQAAILDLYDPNRSKDVLRQGQKSDWASFISDFQGQIAKLSAKQGEGLALLTETTTSPTLLSQIGDMLSKYPKAKWHVYDSVSQDEARKAQQALFGKTVDFIYDFSKAKIIACLDADFVSEFPGSLRYARAVSEKRKDPAQSGKMCRIYSAEPTPSLAGTWGDHRVAASSSEIRSLAESLAKNLEVEGFQNAADVKLPEKLATWLSILTEDLRTHHGRSIVLAGPHQPAWIHTLVYQINAALGNFGKTIQAIDRIDGADLKRGNITELANAVSKNQVETLIILGGNPVYSAPADLDFGSKLRSIPYSVHLSLIVDETSKNSLWHLPAAHFLEMFSDGRASDGTISMVQPLIQPLYGGKSEHELLALLNSGKETTSHDVVKNSWRKLWGELEFDSKWKKALHDGIVSGTASARIGLPSLKKISAAAFESGAAAQGDLDILFRPDASIWDGRFSGNSWLQELPRPMTKLTWDNAALISPALAQSQNIKNGDLVEVFVNGKSLRAPAWILPGQAEKSIVLPLGYGRSSAGDIGTSRGFNAGELRTSSAMVQAKGSLRKSGGRMKLATTQNHHNMEGRELVKQATMTEFLEHPNFAKGHHHGEPLSLYPLHAPGEHAWGMVINLNACTGCNACVIACQSENNIPTVGKKEVIHGREMHWLRIDRYFEGDLDSPEIHQQPVPCMHCENAPCEPVCPVGATNHSPDGINQMIYNRCVGTKYCSNNCPYKVRRFNFFEFVDKSIESLKFQRNPDVTVRSRGVMEKCTFCIQRINKAGIQAKLEDRTVGANEVVTACQSACPTQAITFGDLKKPESEASKLKANPLNYTLLDELNVRPRVSYHAKVKNTHPAIGEHLNLKLGSHV